MRWIALIMAAVLAVLPLAARATVLQELGFEQLVADSRLIFVGEALRHDTEAADGLVYTRVWFRVDELVSGEAPAAEFSLRFVGGSSGGATVDVAGQYIPAVGERALWFVHEPYDAMVNPLTGWHQGAFLIQTTDTGLEVLDLQQRPDLVLLNTRADPLARKMLDTGFAEARIAQRVPGYERFPLQDFIDAIRALGEDAP
jgi:hypothetical protein